MRSACDVARTLPLESSAVTCHSTVLPGSILARTSCGTSILKSVVSAVQSGFRSTSMIVTRYFEASGKFFHSKSFGASDNSPEGRTICNSSLRYTIEPPPSARSSGCLRCCTTMVTATMAVRAAAGTSTEKFHRLHQDICSLSVLFASGIPALRFSNWALIHATAAPSSAIGWSLSNDRNRANSDWHRMHLLT